MSEYDERSKSPMIMLEEIDSEELDKAEVMGQMKKIMVEEEEQQSLAKCITCLTRGQYWRARSS